MTSTQQRLREILENDVARGALVLNSSGTINRTHYSKVLGLTRKSLETYQALVAEFESNLPTMVPLGDRLREALEQDARDGTLSVGRFGQINIAHYAARLGCHVRTLAQFSELLCSYARDVGASLRSALQADFDRGQLLLGQALTALCRHYSPIVGASVHVLRRFSSVFREFDALVRDRIIVGDALAQKLKEDLEANALRTNQFGKVNRAYYAQLFDVTPSAMTYYRSVFDGYDTKLGIPDDVLLLMQAWLQERLALGRLALVHGRVERHAFATAFDLDLETFEDDHPEIAAILERFDREALGLFGTSDDLTAARCRDWLESAYKEGELAWNGSRIILAEVRNHLWNTDRSLVEFVSTPVGRRMLATLEGRLLRTPQRVEFESADAETIIEYLSRELPLNRDNETVNRAEISRRTGVAMARLSREPLKSLLKSYDQDIRREAQTDPMVAYVGRPWNFHVLCQLGMSEEVCVHLARWFADTAKGYSERSLPNVSSALLQALTWIVSSNDPVCQLAVRDMNQRVADSQAWQDAWLLYVTRRQSSQASGAAAGVTNLAAKLLREMGEAGVLPILTRPVLMTTKRDRSTKRKTIAEVVSRKSSPTRTKGKPDDFLEFARYSLAEGAAKRGIELEVGETNSFLLGLREGLEKLDETDGKTDPSEVVLRILRRRLGLLETALCEKINYWKGPISRREELVAKATLTDWIWQQLVQLPLGSRQRRFLIRRYFPKDPKSRDTLIANLLFVATHCYGGLLPLPYETGHLSNFFRDCYFSAGGLHAIEAHLRPHSELVASIVLLYLVASGGNVAVARELTETSVLEGDMPGYVRVAGYKARAGKPVHANLERSSRCIVELEWLISFPDPVRQIVVQGQPAEAGDSRPIFVTRIDGVVRVVEPHYIRGFLKRLVTASPELSELPILPSTIRPSVLLTAVLEHDGNAEVARAIGQHSTETASLYHGRLFPTMLARARRLLPFMEDLEAIIVGAFHELHQRLNLSEQELALRSARMEPTGLGTLCKGRHDRPGQEGVQCMELQCFKCPQLAIVSDVESVALLQIWWQSLREAEGDWMRDRANMWIAEYLPWMCFCEIVAEKMQRGPLVRVWAKAESLARKMMSDPSYIPPQPLVIAR